MTLLTSVTSVTSLLSVVSSGDSGWLLSGDGPLVVRLAGQGLTGVADPPWVGWVHGRGGRCSDADGDKQVVGGGVGQPRGRLLNVVEQRLRVRQPRPRDALVEARPRGSAARGAGTGVMASPSSSSMDTVEPLSQV